MNDNELLRYSRQILLPQVGYSGQERLKEGTFAILGLGGLGSISALYLAAAGVGKLIIADFDRVELSNLQRQIIHGTEDIGLLKTESAKKKLLSINPLIEVECVNEVDDAALHTVAKNADLVLDGTDNFKARMAINLACVRAKTPLVSAAVIRFEGQLSVFSGHEVDQPCYACLYGGGSNEVASCSENGVVAPAPGIVGSLQALEAIKTYLDVGHSLVGELLLVDLLDLGIRRIKINPDTMCLICNGGA